MSATAWAAISSAVERVRLEQLAPGVGHAKGGHHAAPMQGVT